MINVFQVNCFDFQQQLTIQIDSLIEQLQQRKEKLLQYVEEEKEFKVAFMKLASF